MVLTHTREPAHLNIRLENPTQIAISISLENRTFRKW
jgi:hypothetical protein